MLEAFQIGIDHVFSFQALLLIFLGVGWGTIGGMIPGINATVAMALILPFTWSLEPSVALALLLGVYAGAEYGGSIPAVLIGTPGTNAAACTAIDGYAMTNKGYSKLALGTSLYASVIGGIVSAVILLLVAEPLSTVALAFGPAEYFALATTGLVIIFSLAGKHVLKGLLGGLFGIFLCTVGRDPITGVDRFSLGFNFLAEGLGLIPVMMGLFAVSEVIKNLMKGKASSAKETIPSVQSDQADRYPNRKDFRKIFPITIFNGLLGTIIGVMPGVGAATGGFIGYSETKRWFKNTDTFGTGDIRGVAAPEAANNAVTGGAMVPLLSLGIPGSNSTVIMLGALMIHNILPGPMLFESNPEIPYSIFITMFVAYFFLLFVGSVVIRIANKITEIPQYILYISILMLVFIGSYAYNNEIADMFVALFFGILGYHLKKHGIPPTAVVLGFVLGPIMEANLRRALIITDGSVFHVFSNSPITIGLLSVALISFIVSVVRNVRLAK